MKILYLLMVVWLLSGCSSNPKEDGFIGGVAGIMGGGYDRRREQKEAELGAAQQERAGVQAQNNKLKTQYAQKQAEVRQLQAEAEQLQQDTRRLYSKISQLRASTAQAQQQKASLASRLRTTNAKLVKVRNQAASPNAGNQIDSLRRQKSALEAELNGMWEMYHRLQ